MTIGKFEILGTLGTGAGSTVLKVRRADDAKVYALKVVTVNAPEDKRFVEQIQTEYDVASRFQHENLCRALAIDTQKSLFGKVTKAMLLMEYVDGLPLAKCEGFPVIKLLYVFYKTAKGLAQMHAQGYYHADIKPDNIMVTAGNDVKIIDFGVVWRRGEKKDRVQGTLDYLAPEQAKQKVVNAKTDIFNLGATMYRLLARGPIPVGFHEKGLSKMQRVDDLIKPIADLNPNVPADLDLFVRQCMRYQASARPASMKDVYRNLKELYRKQTGKS